MQKQLKDNRVALTYDQIERRYSILVINWLIPISEVNEIKDSIAAWQSIKYCPWCAAKLPTDLMDARDDELGKLGFKIPYDDSIPEEFKTDEWWKKRGL